MSRKTYRVLVVDDDADQLELLSVVLEGAGFLVTATTSPIGVSNTVRAERPDFVLLDLDLPAIPGDRLLELARARASVETLFVLYSGCDPEALRATAERVEAHGFLSKSIPVTELPERLRGIRAEWRAGASVRPVAPQ